MKKQKGFSLVELAIVLVIIGLITGGILTGQDLIRASELNSVVADLNKLKTATNTFKIKYNALPGDMSNMTAYWPTSSMTNGDGNGYVTVSENYMGWRAMALAGLIPGSYTGLSGPGHATTDALIGTNVPALSMNPVGVTFLTMTALPSGNVYYFPGNYGHLFFVGTDGGSVGYTQGPAFRPDEANSLDTKMDDGRPGTGSVLTWVDTYSYLSSSVTCASSTAAYNLTATTVACPLLVIWK